MLSGAKSAKWNVEWRSSGKIRCNRLVTSDTNQWVAALGNSMLGGVSQLKFVFLAKQTLLFK
jgi:hypothetical protein